MEAEAGPVAHHRVAVALQRTSRALALLLAGLGSLGLLGWLVDVPPLARLQGSTVMSMKANTALAFLLAGLGVWLRRAPAPGADPAPRSRAALGAALGATASLIGLATLLEHVTGLDLGIDELLARDRDAPHPFAPGRTSPVTALCLALLGASLATLDLAVRGRRVAQWLAAAAGFLALVPLTAHAYGVETVHGIARFSMAALHTVIGLLLLSLALLFARPAHGLMASLSEDSQPGFLTRRVIPAVVLLPLLVGWLAVTALEAGVYGPRFGLGLLVVATSIGLTLMVGWSLSALRRAEHLQRMASVVLADREELQTTLLSIGDGVISTDADGRIVRMNPIAERLTGWALDEATGRPLDEVFRMVREGTGERIEGPAHRVLTHGVIVGLDAHTLLEARSGARRPIADSSAPIRDASGTIRGVVLVFRDMTAEEHTRVALRESEARHKAALDSALDAVIIMDHTGRVIEWNPAAERTFGHAREEALGQVLADLVIPPALREAHHAGLKRLLTTGEQRLLGRRLELPALRKDGTEFPAEVSIVQTGDPALPVFTAFVRDDSEHKRLEEVRARSLKLEVENRQMQAANRLKSEFLANMSHELRTPLNAIIGFAELLHDGEVSPELPEHRIFLGHILTSGQHLLQLINDVLDLAKVEAGKLEFHPAPIDLGRVISEVLAILRGTAQQKRIPVTLDVSPELTDVVLDPSRLKHFLHTFFSNALSFTPGGVAFSVRARPEGADLFRVEVEDTGIGISEPDIGRLFVEFQQLDAGLSKQHGGTGLGLALARRLVEAQGGSVGVKSELGRGSTFHAVLPRIAAGALRTPARPGPPTVLVVEDDARHQARTVDALKAAGYGVEAATTAEQALQKSLARAFDAVTLDLLLPDMSGVQVLRNLRKEGVDAGAPLVVITAVGERAVSGFAVHDILPKPLDERDLHASLMRAGVEPDKGAVLVVDDDSGALDLMAATLDRLGYRSRCASSGAVGLESAQGAPPAAVVLDLLMPGVGGLEFLERFRQVPRCRRVPVIIWTAKELTPEERARLRDAAQGIVPKTQRGGAAVVAELEAFLAPARGDPQTSERGARVGAEEGGAWQT